jgi:hypothetical protein
VVKFFFLLLFCTNFLFTANAEEVEIKSMEVYTTDNRLALPVLIQGNNLAIEFDVKVQLEPILKIVFRFCDKGWTPTKNIFLLNQNNNFITLSNFKRLPVTVKDADFHFKGTFPDKDGFIDFPFSGKWRFYITDMIDTSLVYTAGRFFVVDNKLELNSSIKNDQLEDKVYWPVELAKVFNITSDFYLPEEFFPNFVGRIEIIQNRNINEPVVIERDLNTQGRQFKWDANRKFTYIARDIRAGNEYRQADIRDHNYFVSKDINAQRDGIDHSRFYQKAPPDMNGNKIYVDYKNSYATYFNVTFSIRPPETIYSDVFLVGAFNDWKLSDDYKLQNTGGIYSITVPLKRGIYDYQYVVADDLDGEIQNEDWVKLEGNTWANHKVYDIFLYYNETNLGGYERIIGYIRLPRTK